MMLFKTSSLFEIYFKSFLLQRGMKTWWRLTYLNAGWWLLHSPHWSHMISSDWLSLLPGNNIAWWHCCYANYDIRYTIHRLSIGYVIHILRYCCSFLPSGDWNSKNRSNKHFSGIVYSNCLSVVMPEILDIHQRSVNYLHIAQH